MYKRLWVCIGVLAVAGMLLAASQISARAQARAVEAVDQVIGATLEASFPTALGEPSWFTATAEVTGTVFFAYDWDFGDGDFIIGDFTTKTTQIISHTFPDTGVYTVVMTVTDFINPVSATAVITVDIPITGLLAANTGPIFPGEVVTLTASVTEGSQVHYAWDLGNGGRASGQIVTATYLETGFYTAVVTASNSLGSQNASTRVQVMGRAFIPQVLLNSGTPARPGLGMITNDDGDGSFVVQWSMPEAIPGLVFTLQEATDVSFTTNVRNVCTTTLYSCNLHGLNGATYYYRVRARNSVGYGFWSDIQSAVVRALPLYPNDPSYSLQWSLPKINAPMGWGLSKGAGFVIAIVDSGIDLDHPDLAGKLVPGYNFVSGNPWPEDDNGHGTHVAGIAAAMTNNGVGVSGVGWNASIMPLKALSSNGSGYTSDIANAIIWAANNGAHIINLSLGAASPIPVVENAINYAHSRGVLVVAAAGNCAGDNWFQNGCSSWNPVMYPAAYSNVVSVGATDPANNRANFSEFNAYLDVVAPGTSIYSTYLNGRYEYMQGTSMSSPFVAGLASLIWAHNPALTNIQVFNLLTSTATDLGSPGRDDYYGYGLINADASVAAAGMVSVSEMTTLPETAAPEVSASTLTDAPRRPGVVLVQFSRGVSPQSQHILLEGYEITVTRAWQELELVELSVPAGSELEVAHLLSNEAGVLFAQPDYLITMIE